MRNAIYWLLSTGLSLAGLAGSIVYLWLHLRRDPSADGGVLGGPRPWRPVGAVMCGLVSILFFVGLHYVNPVDSARLYLALWSAVLLLLLGIVGMAGIDLLYTRRVVRQMRRSRTWVR